MLSYLKLHTTLLKFQFSYQSSFASGYYILTERSHREINIDHGINVDQHSNPRNNCKYCILYLQFFRDFDY
jgi:hypothetical protein